MKVGYAREEITPAESVPLGGFGNGPKRMSDEVLDPLYATCVAFEAEDGTRALIYTVDLIDAGATCTAEIRPAIGKATGVPVDHVHVSGTHTHSAPDSTCTEIPSLVRWLALLKEQMVKAAAAALADLKEAKLYLARTTTYHMNFVRHYVLADGTYYTNNFGHPRLSPPVAHVSEPDAEMLLAKIVRKGGRDIILCNFQMHQTNTGGQQMHVVSADICGEMREAMEKKTGCLFAYFTGASGNLNPSSKIKAENPIPPLNHILRGKALAKYAIGAAKDYRPASFGAIRALHAEHAAKINHATDALLPAAQKVAKLYAETNDRDAAKALAEENGMSSAYHARAIVARVKMGESETVPADVLCVGDLAFVMAPYEMFDVNGMEIKAGSPFPMTMILTLANRKSCGYFPTRATFEQGSYASDTCRFVPGIGEEMSELYIRMLKEIR